MIKRGRTVESQKLRKTIKSRGRLNDSNRDSSATMTYVHVAMVWLLVISLDVLAGFRFELLYPFWLVMRAGYESFQKNHNTFVTLANQNSAKFSVFFVCVTATSDLICYLFIPIPWLIFLASTYVWLSQLWTHLGSPKGATPFGVDRSYGVPMLLLGIFVLAFEYFLRSRCEFAPYGFDDGAISIYFGLSQACEHVQGLTPGYTRNLNAFFGAHCIGYPLVLIFFSLRYYYKEWILRRHRSAVAQHNELYVKLLTEALPAEYMGPIDYSIKTLPTEDECGDMLSSGGGLDLGGATAMLMPPPANSNGAHAHLNGNAKKPAAKASNGNGVRHRGTPARSKGVGQHSTPPQKQNDRRREDEDDTDGSDEWRVNNPVATGGVWWLRFFCETICWIGSWLSSPVERDDVDDDDDSQIDDSKKSLRNGDSSKSRSGFSSRKGRTREKPKEKVITAHPVEREKPSNGSCIPNGKETRDSSRDTSLSQPPSSSISHMSTGSSYELDRVRSEMMNVRAAEQDARLQLSQSKNSESLAKQEASQLRSSLERMETRYGSLEKMRELDRSSLSQLEKKYAELLNRKNDVERDLMAERKARKEDGGKRSDTVEQYRERERQLERDMDRLRAEAVCRDERSIVIERELHELRKYRENNDNDLQEKEIEIRHLRDRITGLEESLQSENRLKQDLFRALGDARTQNAHLEAKMRSMDSSLSVAIHHQSSVMEKASPSQPMPSPPLPPTYNMAMQHAKADNHMGSFLFTALQQHHSSPTGEHVLFDQPPPVPSSCALPMDPLLSSRMGKYGAPANPARIN